MRRIWIVSLALLVILGASILAFDLSFYNSFETLCMGETFTGIANDENALSYNPAGLTNGNGFVLKLPSLDVDMSYGAASATVKALGHIDEIKSVLNSGNNVEIADYFLRNYAKALSNRNDVVLKSAAYVGYEGNVFSIVLSAIGQAYAKSFVSNDLVPFISLHAKAAAYAQAAAALALNFSDFKVSIGGLYRYGYVMPAIYSIDNLSVLMINSSTFDPNLDYEVDANGDLGAKISIGNLSVGGLWHDILSPSKDIRVGIGYATKGFAIGADFEKLLDNDYSFFRRLHFGLKYTPFGFVHLYAGLSAGWPTGGLEVNVGGLKIRAGTYVLNYGQNAGYDCQRMYTIGIGL